MKNTGQIFSFEYSQIRLNWYLISRKERQATYESRANKHNQVIYYLKLVTRYLASEGADASWFAEIEDDRQKIGDFANYIAYVYALNGRS